MQGGRSGDKGNRVVVLGIVGSSQGHGKALLSELLDYDLDSSDLQRGHVKSPHVKKWTLVEGVADAFLDVNRSILYIHVPFDTVSDRLSKDISGANVRSLMRDSNGMLVLALLVAFSVCHFILFLHNDTQLNLELLTNLRTLQVLKNCMFPFVKYHFPLDPNSPMFQINQDLRRWRRVMIPGYCEPQVVFIFQDESGSGSTAAKALTIQLGEILEKCNILSRSQGSEARPLFNTHSRIRALVLHKLAVGLDEELDDWCQCLDGDDTMDLSDNDGMKSLKILIYKRREHMRNMLKSGSYDVFPTVEQVFLVWNRCHGVLVESRQNAVSAPPRNYPPGTYPDIPEPAMEDASREEIQQSLQTAMAWLVFCSDPVHRISSTLCAKAMAVAKEKYFNSVPELYSYSTHAAVLKSAMEAYKVRAQGPALEDFASKLEEQCTLEWRSGHQQCESRSLTGRPCTRALRTVDGEQGTVNVAPCSHHSRRELKQASASGMTMRKRPDPFSCLDANVTFYAECTSDELATCTALPPPKPPPGRKPGKGRGKPKVALVQDIPASFPMAMDLPMVVRLYVDDGDLGLVNDAPQMKKLNKETDQQPEPVEEESRQMSSIVVHGWASMHRLGDASAYHPDHGIQQEGFLPGCNVLHLVDVKIMGNAENSTEDPADTMATHFPPLAGAAPSPALEPLGGQLNTQSLTNRIEREAVLNQWPKHKSGATPSAQSPIKPQAPRMISESSTRRPRRGKRGGRGRGQNSKDAADRALGGRGRQQKAWVALREGVRDLSVEENPHKLYVGLEYESLEGHRFFATGRQVSKGSHAGSGGTSLLGHDVPLFLELSNTAKKGRSSDDGGLCRPGLLCQLQRIFVATPPLPLLFALKPRIKFKCSLEALSGMPPKKSSTSNPPKTNSFEFCMGSEVVLPPDSLCVVKLPFVYGVPGKWFGIDGAESRLDCTSDAVENWVPVIQTNESQPFDAQVVGGSLLYPL
ncbi:hypothetical protein BSKO_01592 [Bryopsis sp. KO-2023]|nr:hypothetical protein BSKO_01592 [Bryopsis sp. KO-2023]